MPESKRRKPRNTGPTKSRDLSRQDAKTQPPSPTWYVVTMTALMAIGVVMVVARFVFSMDQWVTLAGLGLIAVGFLMTTNYR
ncbi:MAG: cell division protein CrgA [Acidimicrobiia bacterium]|nr:cell division protein CrgA [Acidimicrobiia bacterium]MDH4308560.1 cell division protein CrgA [Acidimicrobiia bacterium]